jgi:hypothetical protein
MKGPGQQNDFAKHSKEMTKDNVPKQMDNNDYGKKRKAKAHKFSIKDSNTGKEYGSRAVMETFSDYLINEATEKKLLDKITTLPEIIIGELKKLIIKGAKDINQNWKDAKELVDTAYHVARIRRPIPDQRGAWKQYEALLKFGVHQLWDTRGNKGDWRAADVMYGESHIPTIEPLLEGVGGKRFFVKIPNAMDVEIDASDMTEVIKELTNKIRRQGGHVEVRHRNEHGALLVIWKNDEEIEEITIQMVS